MRAGVSYTIGAALLAAFTTLLTTATAAHQTPAVSQLAVVNLVAFMVLLILGSRRFIGWTALAVLAMIAIEAGVGNEPIWIRSLTIGCLWFVAVEAAWEAIERRDGATYSRRAQLQRVQDVATVVGVSVAVGLVAIAATSFAPVRSVALQAFVLLVLLVGLSLFARSLVEDQG